MKPVVKEEECAPQYSRFSELMLLKLQFKYGVFSLNWQLICAHLHTIVEVAQYMPPEVGVVTNL